MKKQFCKTMSYVMTAALLLGVSMPSSPAAAKKKAPKLSTKKVSISVGQKKTIKLKNGKKAVWSIKSGKKVVSLSKKKKTSVVVKGKKAGKAVVLAKVGKKKLTCKVTVKAKKPAVTKAPAITTAPNTNKPSTAPTATPTAVVPTPTVTPEQGEAVKDITIDMTKVGDTEFRSSPATINFSSQLDSRFDLAYFKEVKIGYELTFEGEDTSKLTAGKIAVAGTTDQLTGFDDGEPKAETFMELLIPDGAEIISAYQHPNWKKYAAVTHHTYESGNAWYIGCMFEECYLQQLLIKILAKASVNAAVPEKFPVIVREGVNEQGEKLRFYLNYSWEEQRVEVADDFEVVLGNGDSTKHEIYLSAWDVCIIKFEK